MTTVPSTKQGEDAQMNYGTRKRSFSQCLKDRTSNSPYLKRCRDAALGLLHITIDNKITDDHCLQLSKRVAELTEWIAVETRKAEGQEDTTVLKSAIDAYSQCVAKVKRYLDQRANCSVIGRMISRQDELENLKQFEKELAIAHQSWMEKNVAVLRDGLSRIESTAMDPPPSPCSIRLPPEPRTFFGRDDLIAPILSAIEAGSSVCLGLLGGGGMGKSTAALKVTHNEVTRARFGENRYFIHCDAVKDANGLLVTMASHFRLKGEWLADQVWGFLQGLDHVFLCLDDLEKCLEEDKTAATEVLTRLSRMKGVTLLITARGTVLPYGPDWTQPTLPSVEPLDEEAARMTFLAVSQKPEDDNLIQLLRTLCCIPLAVKLAAVLARDSEMCTPTALLKRWPKESTSLLHCGQEHRKMSVDFSIRLSLESFRMTKCPEALQLLSMASHLPHGIRKRNLELLTPEGFNGWGAHTVLIGTALVHEDSKHDLRMHSLVRAYVQTHHPPDAKLLQNLEAHYLASCRFRDAPRNQIQAEEFNSMVEDIDNMQSVLDNIFSNIQERRLKGPAAKSKSSITSFSPELMDAVFGLTLMQYWSGRRSTDIQTSAVRESESAGKHCQAVSLYCLARAIGQGGDVAKKLDYFQRALALFQELDEHEWTCECATFTAAALWAVGRRKEAEATLNEAILVGRHINDAGRVGWCLRERSIFARIQGNRADSTSDALELLELARRCNDERLEATGLDELAQLRMDQEKYEEAQDAARQSMKLSQRLGCHVLAAHSSWVLGEILNYQQLFTAAEAALKEALVYAKRTNSFTYQTACCGSLADMFLTKGDTVSARPYLELQLEGARVLNSKLHLSQGERLLGDCDRHEGKYVQAREHYDAALKLCEGSGWEQVIDVIVKAVKALDALEKGPVETCGSTSTEDTQSGPFCEEEGETLKCHLGTSSEPPEVD